MSENSHIWCTYEDPEKSKIQKFQTLFRVLVPDLFPQGKESFNNTLIILKERIILELFHGYEALILYIFLKILASVNVKIDNSIK